MTTPDPQTPPQEQNEVPKTEVPNTEMPKNEAPKKEAPKKVQPVGEKHGFFDFVKDNIWESISYVVLFAGLIFSFPIFNPFLGGALVGIILGIYFSQEIIDRSMAFKEMVMREGIFRGFIVIAAVLALLVQAFGLVLGTIIGAWIRPYLGDSISSPFDKQ